MFSCARTPIASGPSVVGPGRRGSIRPALLRLVRLEGREVPATLVVANPNDSPLILPGARFQATIEAPARVQASAAAVADSAQLAAGQLTAPDQMTAKLVVNNEVIAPNCTDNGGTPCTEVVNATGGDWQVLQPSAPGGASTLPQMLSTASPDAAVGVAFDPPAAGSYRISGPLAESELDDASTVSYGAGDGDGDGDGDVDALDFLLLRAALGTTVGDPAFNPSFDIDGDGDIDAFDFALFRGLFGT